jgi:hypothetical protein
MLVLPAVEVKTLVNGQFQVIGPSATGPVTIGYHVTGSIPVDVLLMDTANYQNFQNSLSFSYLAAYRCVAASPFDL